MNTGRLSKPLMIGLIVSFLALAAMISVFSAMSKKRVDYYRIQPVNINYSILASGRVNRPLPYDVVAESSGKMTSVDVAEGASIIRGQVLFQVDDFQERQNLAIARADLNLARLKQANLDAEFLPKLREQLEKDQANLKTAQNNLERLQKLDSIGAVARADLERGEADYQTALSTYRQTQISIDAFSQNGGAAENRTQIGIREAQIRLLEKSLNAKRITAPFDGTVLNLYFREGQVIQAGNVVATLIPKQNWMVETQVDQKELPYLKPGLSGRILFDSYPDKPLPVRLAYIAPVVEPKNGSILIRLEITQPKPFIKFGLSANIEIDAFQYRKVIALPARYVRNEGERAFVWGLEKNQIQKRWVRTRPIGDKWVLVPELKPGTRVLTGNAYAQGTRAVPGREVGTDEF